MKYLSVFSIMLNTTVHYVLFLLASKKERKKGHFLEGGSQATMVPFALHAMVSTRPQFQAWNITTDQKD
ncbi:hypothetical protein KFE94_13960 [bacterium SCSIO 12643]|nr:hypothetical protein KFE94_13960 [bacterium SCSIO 12643]